jgi:hypothetical protein
VGFSDRSFCLMILCATFVCMPQNSRAGPTECQDAIAEYKSAMAEVSTALQTYSSCLSTDDGHDDCSTEFETLKSAQEAPEKCSFELWIRMQLDHPRLAAVPVQWQPKS